MGVSIGGGLALAGKNGICDSEEDSIMVRQER